MNFSRNSTVTYKFNATIHYKIEEKYPNRKLLLSKEYLYISLYIKIILCPKTFLLNWFVHNYLFQNICWKIPWSIFFLYLYLWNIEIISWFDSIIHVFYGHHYISYAVWKECLNFSSSFLEFTCKIYLYLGIDKWYSQKELLNLYNVLRQLFKCLYSITL